MNPAIVSLFVIIFAIVALCLPPIVAFLMAARRNVLFNDDRRTTVRFVMIVSVAVLAFNILLLLFAPPHFGAGEPDGGLTRLHAVALVLSWLCLWAAFAMGLLMRLKRRTIS